MVSLITFNSDLFILDKLQTISAAVFFFLDKILKDNNVFYENIGITQSDFFEIEGELKINIKDLFKINNEWYKNY